jgi:hypothetical protein
MDNGQSGPIMPGVPGAPPEMQVQIQNLIATLEPGMRAVCGTMVRGLLVSSPGVNPAILLNLIAFHTGNMLAQSLQGDIATLHTLREGFREAFKEGIKAAPLIKPLGNMPGSASMPVPPA